MAQSQTAKEAMEAFDRAKQGGDAVGTGSHAHSQAAHLETEGRVHTTPEGYGKQGREPGTVNQPPQDPKRNGKARGRE